MIKVGRLCFELSPNLAKGGTSLSLSRHVGGWAISFEENQDTLQQSTRGRGLVKVIAERQISMCLE